MRSTTAGAISAFVGLLLVLPLIVNALPDPLNIDVSKYNWLLPVCGNFRLAVDDPR